MEPYQKRLAKELAQLVQEPSTGIRISEEEAAKDMRVWTVTIDGASNTLYEGETFKLRFKFDPQYPFTSPEVMFVGESIPVHPHICQKKERPFDDQIYTKTCHKSPSQTRWYFHDDTV